MHFFIFPLIASMLLLTSCASNVHEYSQIDPNVKTISVPSGAKGLKGDLKKALSERGWKMPIYNQTLEAGSGVSLSKSRYTLVGESQEIDTCFNFSPYIKYDVAVIDNKSGEEVFSLDGIGCQGGVVEKFIQKIEGQE